MLAIYNFITTISIYFLRIASFFSPKIKLFVVGRKTVFKTLEQNISKTDKTIWIHTASLGEFEQGLPIIEELKKDYPNYKIDVSFFSPSGYEVKKNTPVADCVVYLPLDTKKNAKKFIQLINPELAIFVKYEFWPNYLQELQKTNTNTLLVSGIFRENQIFFKFYGNWMRKSLKAFNHFFVQNMKSKELLNSINFTNITVAGDTRFDRVTEILKRDNSLKFITDFKKDKTTIVYGSSWDDDEKVYLDFLNNSSNIKHIIAPHNINKAKIEKLIKSIKKPVILYSELSSKNISEYDVFIVDTIGLLTKIYNYADIAYVGGAFKTGLHNVLEPAVFGIPVIIGPNYEKFQEAVELVSKKGVLSITSKTEYEQIIKKLIENTEFRKITGGINNSFIETQSGATSKTIDYVKNRLL